MFEHLRNRKSVTCSKADGLIRAAGCLPPPCLAQVDMFALRPGPQGLEQDIAGLRPGGFINGHTSSWLRLAKAHARGEEW